MSCLALRAQIMLRIDELMVTLSLDDAAMVAVEVFNTYGNTNGKHEKHPEKTRGKHVGKHVENTEKTPAFSGVGGAIGGDGLSLSPRKRDPVREQQALEVLDFLNLKASKNYRPVEENLRFIRARLNTCSASDLKGVIARKTREWLNTEHAKYLRPATLFNATKFEQYIGEQGT